MNKTKLIIIIITAVLVALVVIVALRPQDESNLIIQNTNLEDITFVDGRVNIYYFWGEGCPHCKAQFDFFETLVDEYGQYFIVYSFEVWNNRQNARLLDNFAKIMNENVSGIPFTIIGGRVFTGFDNSMKNDIINAIRIQANNEFDVYKEHLDRNS